MKHRQQLRRFADDERGVSPVVGFVLIFALIMIVFTLYQSSVVPAQNEDIEYEHGRLVEGQLQQLSAAFVSTGPDDPPEAVSLQLGVRYPARALAINPGTPVGSLDSTGPHTVEIASDRGTEEFRTSFIHYTPEYNMRSERTRYSIEYGMLVKDYSNAGTTRLASSGSLFSADGKTVNLNLVGGTVSANRMSTVVTTENVDTHTINVSSDSATLTLPTTLKKEAWDGLLTDEDGTYINQVDGYTYSNAPSEISIDLTEGVAIDLSKVSTGDSDSTEGIEMQPSVTNVTPTAINASPNGTTHLTVRTTDVFGSPLSGVDIEAHTAGSGTLTPRDTSSNGSGEATFAYESGRSDSGSTVAVTASLPNGSDGTNNSVTFGLNHRTREDTATSNETSREPLNVNNVRQGTKTLLEFKLTPGNPIAVSGFSVRTKSAADALNETASTHRFRISRSERIDGVSSGNELRYASGEPIQFDGQDYIFIGGPRRVTSSTVVLAGWPRDRNVQINGFTDTYADADIVVYFITENGKRPVYIDATVAGSSTVTTTNTPTTTANSSARPDSTPFGVYHRTPR